MQARVIVWAWFSSIIFGGVGGVVLFLCCRDSVRFLADRKLFLCCVLFGSLCLGGL